MFSSAYRCLTAIGAPFVGAYMRLRLAKGREDQARFAERFGYFSKPRPEGRVVWCHAASVGESVSLLLLIEKMHENFPDLSFVLTTGTVTAAHLMERRLPSYALHQYVPIDLRPCLKRFLDHWKPTLAIWIESELWPNTLAMLRARAIPSILLNARMSEKSFRHWSCAKGFARELLSTFSLCLAQTEADRERFAALGAAPVHCVGNLKYASSPLPFNAEELAQLQELTKDRPLWLMASTHPGEEELAIEAHCRLSLQHPRLLTILAPRHPVRGDEILAKIANDGLTFARRSRNAPIKPDTQIYLADTMGEMGLFYAWSPITVIGGSFAGTGGHNPIEPAHLGSAVVFGPSMFNFSEIEKEFMSRQAALSVPSGDDIAPAVHRLLQETDLRGRQAQAARLLAEEKRSILGRIINEMNPWLKRSRS